MSASNPSEGNTEGYREMLETDTFFEEESLSGDEDMNFDFEEGNTVFYLAEDVAHNVDIGNVPECVYYTPEERLVRLEEPMNVDIMGHPAEEPSIKRPADPDVKGGGIGVQVVPGLSKECLPNERNGATAQQGDRGQGRGCGTAVLGDAEWRKGDRLVGVYETDEDIPGQLRKRLEAHARGRAKVRRANEDDANDDERSDNGTMADDDIMKEYKRFCKSDAARFDWKSMDSFQGAKELFQVDRTGPTCVFQNPYDAFREYWDDAALQHIVYSTNVFGDAVPETEKTFHRYWYHTNIHEILILFAFWMMLGVVSMPSIKSCFSNGILLKSNVFRTMFTEGRYWSLNRALCFAPNETAEQNPDKLRHIRPILNHLNRKFKECYVPSQDVRIDESVMLWRGPLSFRQCTRTNAAKFGVQTYELRESASGYLWSFFIYTGSGSDSELSDYNKTVETVLKLIGPLLGKGYQLFTDNFFNSLLLARFLKRNQTDCVGTLTRNRKHIPPLISTQKLRPGSYMARHADDVVLLSQTYRKPLVMVTTHHGTEQNRTRERPGRPFEYKFVAVTDYNIGICGIDKHNQMLEPHVMERKHCKWWFNKYFKRLLNITILNSRVLVQKSSGNTTIDHIFRLELVRDILQKHVQLLPRPPRAPVARASTVLQRNYFVCNESSFHAIKKIDQKRRQGSNRGACVQCRWCRDQRGTRSRTAYECNLCKVPLCIEPCFTKFHTHL